MKNFIAKNYRAKEILKLLIEQGPLTFQAMLLMVTPSMKARKLQAALKRLREKGFVDVRIEKILGDRFFIYQVTQNKRKTNDVTKFLDCEAGKIIQPYFRYRELLYNDATALLTYKLKRAFADVQFIRNFELSQSKLAQLSLGSLSCEHNLKPDLLMYFPSKGGFSSVTVAFETEKARTTDKKLSKRIRQYASYSNVDAVIYYCWGEALLDAVESNYESQILSRALRKKQCDDDFFMLGSLSSIPKNDLGKVYKATGESVNLKAWINTIRNKKHNLVSSKNSAIRTVQCPQEALLNEASNF